MTQTIEGRPADPTPCPVCGSRTRQYDKKKKRWTCYTCRWKLGPVTPKKRHP